jgi:uncharacterized protein YndB with AHSA1/START domain
MTISDTITRAIFIAAPIGRVWDVVCVPGWWINAGEAIDLSTVVWTGPGTATVHDPTHGDFDLERFDVQAPRSVSFRWLVSGVDGGRSRDAAEDQFLHTVVTFTLIEEGEGTRLTVVESGFATALMDDQARRRAFDGNVEGWAIELALLQRHIETDDQA